MGKRIIRTSDRNQFRTCRQSWDWSSKIRSNLEPSERYAPFEDGTTWHEAMATYYDPATWHLLDDPVTAIAVHQSARDTLLLTHDSAIKQATELLGEETLPEERLDEYAERFQMLAGMLEHYFVWAPKHDDFTPVKIEIEFEVPVLDNNGYQYVLDGDEVVYQGRLDGLAQDPQGRYWILEHKTTGQMGRTEWLELDAQCGSYAWAMQHMLGLDIAGIIYSQALKKAPKPPKRLVNGGFSKNKQQATTYDLYKTALDEAGESEAAYGEFLSFLASKPNPFFRRIPIFRNAASLKYMGETIYMEAQEMLEDPRIYPSPGMFNCNGCRFKEPCIAKQNGYDFQFILDELYTERV